MERVGFRERPLNGAAGIGACCGIAPAGQQGGTIGLLMRTVVSIKRIMEKPPSGVYQIAGRKQHQQSRIVAQKATAARNIGRRMRVPQNLQAGIPEGQSGLAETLEGTHQGIIGQKRHGHIKFLNKGLCSVTGACRPTSECVWPCSLNLRVSVALSPSVAPTARSHMAFNRILLTILSTKHRS